MCGTKDDDEKISTLMDCAQALAEEATYVVRNTPRWSPGKMDGEPMEVDYTIPINFELK